MKRVLLLLVLVAGAALAKEEAPNEVIAEPEEEAEGRLMFGASSLMVAKSFISVVWEGFSVAAQIVILVALVFLIATLASAKTMLRNEAGGDYEYYQVPEYAHSGYDASGGSSYASGYASGYSKRSADFPSFLNLPIVQRLTERVHQAIEEYSAQY